MLLIKYMDQLCEFQVEGRGGSRQSLTCLEEWGTILKFRLLEFGNSVLLVMLINL